MRPPLLLLVPLLLLGGCRCERRRDATPQATAQAVRAARERAALRALGVREQMRRLAQLTRELRRRALGRAGWAAPARRVAALAEALDPRAALPDFAHRVQTLRARASQAVAVRGSGQVQAYNTLVAACRGCHVRHAGSATARQRSEQAVPPPLPGSGR